MFSHQYPSSRRQGILSFTHNHIIHIEKSLLLHRVLHRVSEIANSTHYPSYVLWVRYFLLINDYFLIIVTWVDEISSSDNLLYYTSHWFLLPLFNPQMTNEFCIDFRMVHILTQTHVHSNIHTQHTHTHKHRNTAIYRHSTRHTAIYRHRHKPTHTEPYKQRHTHFQF